MSRLAKKKKGGFTLIEVLMTISLIMIVMLPLSQFVKNAQETSLKAKRKQEGGSIGQSVLEQIGNTNTFYSDDKGTYINLKNGNDIQRVDIQSNEKSKAITDYSYKDGDTVKKYSLQIESKKVDKYTYNYSSSNTTDNRDKIVIYKDDGTVNSDIFNNYSSLITFFNNGRVSFGKSNVNAKSFIDGNNLFIKIYTGDTGKYVYSLNEGSYCLKDDIPIENSDSIQKGTSYCKILLYFSETGKLLTDGNAMEEVDKNPFNGNIKIYVRNEIDETVYFDLVKGKNVKGSIDVLGNESNTASQNNFSINKYDYSNNSSKVILGDLYEVNVKVVYNKDKNDAETLFNSKTVKNLTSE